MRARRLVPVVIAILLFPACSAGETRVEGGGDTGTTGPTATTGPTGATSVTGAGGEFDGPVSLDLTQQENPTGAAVYSCDGVEGTWTYDPGKLPVSTVVITIQPSQVDMDGGDGTLVIEGDITIPGGGTASFVDTVELRLVGSADAPAMQAAGVKVKASGLLEGLPFDLAKFFPEKVAIPIVPGADQC